MQQHNIDRLEKYRHHYETFQQLKWMPYLDDNAKHEILDVIHQEFDARYSPQLWCGPCVAEMVNYAFNAYNQQKQ